MQPEGCVLCGRGAGHDRSPSGIRLAHLHHGGAGRCLERCKNRNVRVFAWQQIAHAAGSRRPPIPLSRIVARTPRHLGFVHRHLSRPAEPSHDDSQLLHR